MHLWAGLPGFRRKSQSGVDIRKRTKSRSAQSILSERQPSRSTQLPQPVEAMRNEPERANGPKSPCPTPTIECISAVTLATEDMARAVGFYNALGFPIRWGGERSSFTSLHAGSGYLNLMARPGSGPHRGWGRVIFYVSDVDAFYARAVTAGLQPDTAPADAPWGERFFHLTDPDGHELSFARPLSAAAGKADSPG
jgi:catechol 2,3-dioxygenase-like lactoylglutathione lyase family enzyme